MTIVPVTQMLSNASLAGYAVGFFECWNLESLMAVADAAQATRSPVLLGFSGIYLPHPERSVKDSLSTYTLMGLDICENLSVPSNLVFNESPHLEWILKAIELGFGMVMFSDERQEINNQITTIKEIAELAHKSGVAVEGELLSLPGVGGSLSNSPTDLRLTNPQQAREFIEETGVDILAVNLGQFHLHGRRALRLNLDLLEKIMQEVDIPLALHGASSICLDDVRSAIKIGIRKINLSSKIKQAYFEAVRLSCLSISQEYNPYEVIGSGLQEDILVSGRLTMQKEVENWMTIFGSAGKA
jgi:ketose-bisphosphate aldolase